MTEDDALAKINDMILGTAGDAAELEALAAFLPRLRGRELALHWARVLGKAADGMRKDFEP